MKTCYKCKNKKENIDFSKNKRYDDGLNDICKSCKKENNILNLDSIITYRKKYNLINKDELNTKSKQHYYINKDHYKKYNKNRDKKTIQQYNQNSKEYKKRWNQHKYKNDIQYKLSMILRIRLLDALKKKDNKIQSALVLLGCSINEFKTYLSKQFKENMTWENYGKIWEIDHIKPCSSFDLTKLEEQQKCFHYTNMQPLTIFENRSKKDKIL